MLRVTQLDRSSIQRRHAYLVDPRVQVPWPYLSVQSRAGHCTTLTLKFLHLSSGEDNSADHAGC